MKNCLDMQKRARTAFDRNWRVWASDHITNKQKVPALTMNLHPPRESDLAAREELVKAREWVAEWRMCSLPGVEWQQKSWPRVGNQSIPVRVSLEGPGQIALWAERLPLWETALMRIDDVLAHLDGEWQRYLKCELSHHPATRCAEAIKTSIADWCAFDESDWQIALNVWGWLFAHPGETRYVRQLPIHGIDTKWIEQHGKALRALYRSVTGIDFSFAHPAKQFRCKACCPETTLAGCSEFTISAVELAQMRKLPSVVVICENLVNTLCLDDLPGTLAIHGSGFAILELRNVPWLADRPLLYWGDLDSSGFAILNALRTFAPHAHSIMMNTCTLNRHFDLCVEEPKPATGSFEHLTSPERDALHLLAQGDPTRTITNLRLEQERIEWEWALDQLKQAIASCVDT